MTYASSPFEFSPTVRDDLFADRIQETQRLITNFRLGVNTILISPRRMGKTSLVIKAQSLATSDTLRIASMDIFGCRSPADFLTAYAAAVVKAAGRKTDNWLRTARQFLSALAPEITFGNDPQNQFSLRFGIKDLPQRTEDILNLPERIALQNKVRIVSVSTNSSRSVSLKTVSRSKNCCAPSGNITLKCLTVSTAATST